jgi:glycosyltransferase involved in cell wall biosynthesis
LHQIYNVNVSKHNHKFILRSLVDFIEIVFPLPKAPKRSTGKRILVYNWRDTRHTWAGGAEVYVHELAKRWVKSGHHVTVFCGNDGKLPRREQIDGVNIVRRGGFYMVYFWAFAYYVVRFRGRYDIIMDCHNGIPFFTPLYAKEPVIGVVHHIHQVVFKEYLPAPAAALAAWMERDVMPWAYRNKRFITVSESTRHEMEELGLVGAGISVVHNGVDLSELTPGPKHAEPLVLYLGRLAPYKSVDVLIRAFGQIVERVPGARLIIAGSGEDSRRLKLLATRMKLRPSIDFVGHVSNVQKIALYQRAWVFVNPSFMEGWGITTIEANACGTPTVGADVAGLRDSIDNPTTGYLTPHGDSEALADRITTLLTDHNLRSNMSINAVKWARRFEWDESSSRAMSLLEATAR